MASIILRSSLNQSKPSLTFLRHPRLWVGERNKKKVHFHYFFLFSLFSFFKLYFVCIMSASSSVADVDAWISQLQDCKQLSENDIKKLCDKVKIKM